MQQLYNLNLGEDSVGQVSVLKQGLYYVFKCIAVLPQKDSFRLWVEMKDHSVDLGLLVPASGCFELTKRMSIKSFTTEPMRFYLRQNKDHEIWLPIEPDVPFANIAVLGNARLKYRDGKPGVVVNVQSC